MDESRMLPAPWVDQLFRRFREVWGVQRFGTAMTPPDGKTGEDWLEDVTNAWRAQLGAFDGETIKRALQAAIDSGREWPPTLPEFRSLCRDFNRPEHRSTNMLPPPGQSETDRETARVLIQTMLKEALAGPMDPLFWAKHPKSAKAVEFIKIGADRGDRRLRDILAELIVDPTPCRSEEAKAALHSMRRVPA